MWSQARLARATGSYRRTVVRWFACARFRAWWSTAMRDLTQRMLAGAVPELQDVVRSDLAPGVKRALLENLLGVFAPVVAGSAVAQLRAVAGVVLTLLEHWDASDGKLARNAQSASIANTGTDAAEGVLELVAEGAALEAARHVREVERPAPEQALAEHRYTSAHRRPPTVAAPHGRGYEDLGRGGRGSRITTRRRRGQRTPPVLRGSTPGPHLWGPAGRCQRCGRKRSRKGGGVCRAPRG